MSIAIGIFAHVDAGKTSLSEQILYKTGTTRTIGKVDDKNSILDNNEIERQRGITVFADEANFKLGNSDFYLIDTPGHIDFAGEMERSILAIDVAILVISAVEGVESHTETIWNLLRKNNIPTIIFINKIDRDIANPKAVIDYIKTKWTANLSMFDESFSNGVINDELAQIIASANDELMETYFDGEKIDEKLSLLLNQAKLFPVVCGCAIRDINVDILLKILETFFSKDSNDDKPFKAVVYKIRHDKKGARLVHLKLLSGIIKAKTQVDYLYNDEIKTSLINEVYFCNGNKYSHAEFARTGQLCAVSGLETVKVGDIVGENPSHNAQFNLKPLLRVKVLFSQIDAMEMLKMLRQIEDEEPLLSVNYNENLKEIHIEIMGEIQLEILKNIFLQRFNTNIDFGECEILYKETIKNEVLGCGHFEPLRHYAEVHLKLTPINEDKIEFASECSNDILTISWQRLVETHIFEKQHIGVLTGSPISGIRISLVSGRAHIKYTDGGDFRESTYRAIRQALMKAENILLEPYFKFEIVVEPQFSGRVFADITKMGGEYELPESLNNEVLIKGSCPVRTMQNYSRELTSYTGGRGKISMNFENYRHCEVQEEIIEKMGYNPEADIANTPNSVFCSHGVGFTVKWNEVENYMHIK
ncbi:MAG: TetM/TetW/TetO/TetS family tetracycline resistance ribosomal protection protein [Oscillospiraceae bacterium]